MKVTIKDDDVMKLIVEYLQSRNLFLSADSLQIEAGIFMELDEPMKTLKRFALEGKWKGIRKYMQAFINLYGESFQTKKLLYFLHRQRFCEVCLSGKQVDDVNVELKDILDEVLDMHNDHEYAEIMNNIRHYYETMSEKYPLHMRIHVMRSQTLCDIIELIKPFLLKNGMDMKKNDDKLVSLLMKGMLYDECSQYCCDRSLGNLPPTREIGGFEIDSDSRMKETSIDDVNACLFYWIQNIKEDRIFNEEFHDKELEIIHERFIRDEKEIIPSPTESPIKNDRTGSVLIKDDDKMSQIWNEPESFHALPTLNGTEDASVRRSQVELEKSVENIDKTVTVEVDVPSGGETTVVKNLEGNPDVIQPVGGNVEPPVKPSSGDSVRDSYAEFLAEQNEVKKQRDQFMSEIQSREKEMEKRRRKLMEDGTFIVSNQPTTKPPLPSPLDESTNQIPNKSVHLAIGALNKPTPISQGDLPGKPSLPQIERRLVPQYFPLEKTEDSAVIRSVTFHPQGHVFAVGSNSRSLKLCAVPQDGVPRHRNHGDAGMRAPDWTQIVVKKSRVHAGSIYSLAWNDAGNILASCSNDKLIKLFKFDKDNLSLTDPQFELSHHDGGIRDIAFVSGFDSVLASGGASDCVVYTYACDVDTIMHQLSGHSDQVLSLYSWGNGMLASSSQDRSVRLWDLRSSRCVSVLGFGNSINEQHIPTSVCVDTRGQYLAVGREDNMISIYDLQAGKSVKDFMGHSGEVRSVRFHPHDGGILLSGSYDGTALVTDISCVLNGSRDMTSCSYRCVHHRDKVIQCRWHPSGRLFASTSADQSCVLWNNA